MSWETVIGLEVHVQLGTVSKLFCGCATAVGDAPNTNVCPVCLGLPGALPVTNREAVRLAIRASLALGFTVHETSVFARKNYFYPDLPKAYQISQFERPLATGGTLAIASPERGTVTIGITRLHLEEDAGKLVHDRFPGLTAADYNRTGTPLAEIVSEPDLRSPGEAREYLNALKQILRYLEVSDCNMEEGRLRVDANISVRPVGETSLGVKQEIKNMNSFSAAERALSQLRDRQIATLEDGGAVQQATFSAATERLRQMRSKEESHDYRYFPDPDLPVLYVAPAWVAEERVALPELPAAKRARFASCFGVTPYEAEVITSSRETADYYERLAGEAEPKQAANWMLGPVMQDLNESGNLRVTPPRVATLIAMVADHTVSFQAAKRLFAAIAETDEEPRAAATRMGLVQVGDASRIAEWVREALGAHPDEAQRLREGEHKLLGFFVGRVMKASGGKADPKKVQEEVKKIAAP